MSSYTVTQNIINALYKRRENWAHKGDFGRVLIIGGSIEYTGSPALVALAALRSGCDLARIVAPRRCADACSSFSPELITVPFQKDFLDASAMPLVRRYMPWSKATSIGNGLGTGNGQKDLVDALLKESKTKLVLDADALKVLDKGLVNEKMLLTPNTNEFNLLFDMKLAANVEERAIAVKGMAKKYGTNILLKGHIDVISDGEDVFLNKTNSAYMTKGGTGDTLTGICASLISQGNDILTSACGAAFINGYAGRTAGKAKRESFSVIDLIDNIYMPLTKWRHQ